MNRANLAVSLAVPFIAALAHAGAPLPPEPDNGFVTEVHKAMVGKIVFAATSAAVTTPEKPAEFTDNFTNIDDIFLRAYLPMSLNNAFRAQGVECARPARVWSLFVDGTPVHADRKTPYFFREELGEKDFKRGTSIRFSKPLNGATDDEPALWNAYNQLVASALTPGEHKITITIRGRCEDLKNRRQETALAKELAVGTFKLTVPGPTRRFSDTAPKPGR